MRICSIVGARPQFVKPAVVYQAVSKGGSWTHRIIHTGQHYDASMSPVFFEELAIPRPDHDLDEPEWVEALERELAKSRPSRRRHPACRPLNFRLWQR